MPQGLLTREHARLESGTFLAQRKSLCLWVTRPHIPWDVTTIRVHMPTQLSTQDALSGPWGGDAMAHRCPSSQGGCGRSRSGHWVSRRRTAPHGAWEVGAWQKTPERGRVLSSEGPPLPGPLRPQPRGPPLTSEMTTARPHSSLPGTCALVTLPSAALPVPAPPKAPA